MEYCLEVVALVQGPSVVGSRREMLLHPDRDQFIIAEQVEVENMTKNGVFKVVKLPKGARAIGSKFTYKIKVNEHGKVIQHKARLVARGFEQRPGIDYLDTSAPVAGVTAFRLLVVIALLNGWTTYSWDVQSAFLHSKLTEVIYMKPPHGYTGSIGLDEVFLLEKTLYGLKQAAAEWHLLLSGALRSLGYESADQSNCLWVKKYKGHTCIVCHHVDDCAATASCNAIAYELRDMLQSKFGLTDSGDLTWHLGMNVSIIYKQYAIISQRLYVESIMNRFGMANAKSVPTPMCDSRRISVEDCPAEVDDELRQEYMELVGSLMYLAHMTRPDIGLAVSQLGGVLTNPGPVHMQAAKRVVRYLSGTKDLGLKYTY